MKQQFRLLKEFYNNPTTELYKQFEYNDTLKRHLSQIKRKHHEAELLTILRNSPLAEKITEVLCETCLIEKRIANVEEHLQQYDGPWEKKLKTAIFEPELTLPVIILYNGEERIYCDFGTHHYRDFTAFLDKEIVSCKNSKEYHHDYIRRYLTGKLTPEEKRIIKSPKVSKWEEKLGRRRIKKALKGQVLVDYTYHKRYDLTDKQWSKYSRLLKRKDKWSDERRKFEYGSAEYKRAERNYRKVMAERAEMLCSIMGID